MAFPLLPVYKRSKVVYGKAGSKSKYGTYVDEEERREPLLSAPATHKAHLNPKSRDGEHGLNKLKPVKSTTKASSTFDVPSSDEEDSATPRDPPLPPINRRKNIVEGGNTAIPNLASWERRKLSHAPHSSQTQKDRSSQPETVVASRPAKESRKTTTAAGHIGRPQSAERKQVHLYGNGTTRETVDDTTEKPISSASARLAVRKRAAVGSTHAAQDTNSQPSRTQEKRPASQLEVSQILPKKARRNLVQTPIDNEAMMTDASAQDQVGDQEQMVDVFDFPDSCDGKAVGVTAKKRQKTLANKYLKRVEGTAIHQHPTNLYASPTQHRVSEPATTDTESPEASTRSPSPNANRGVTPPMPSTSTSATTSTPLTAIKAAGTMTPKQARLWNRLLIDEPAVPSPSTLPINELGLSEKSESHPLNLHRRLAKYSSTGTRRRTRLVDRLKASAPTSNAESDTDDTDTEIRLDSKEDLPTTQPALSQTTSDPAQLELSASQSSSQARPSQGGGPRITYTSSRSFLPEDSLEDELMLGLITDAPSKPHFPSRNVGKERKKAQKSDFDLEDSDDDDGAGKLRTIHELRAAGRNIRTMEDIDGLFRDIENHNASNRTRRRSALVELATRLSEKAFSDKFIAHGFENQLVSECASSPDNIADFALAASLGLLVSVDLSEHSMSSIKTSGVLEWLARMLVIDMEPVKLVRDRANNMSRVSQGSFIEFSEKMRVHPQIWEGKSLTTITPRLLSLRCLEILVKKLRRAGDTSVLLGSAHCVQVLPVASELSSDKNLVETETAISLLEMLSTSASSVDWPVEIITQVARILTSLKPTSLVRRNSLFLALRLCINLTNTDARSCNALATAPAVECLMRSVSEGFDRLDNEPMEDDLETRSVTLDLLVLAMGVMTNLAEHSDLARQHARADRRTLDKIVQIFQDGQKRMLDAESVEESISNVAFGYLAVMLANLCRDREARKLIAAKLPKQNLNMLVEAVDEFIAHHQKVDKINFDGDEGKEVWSAFTEKLKVVLENLKAVANFA